MPKPQHRVVEHPRPSPYPAPPLAVSSWASWALASRTVTVTWHKLYLLQVYHQAAVTAVSTLPSKLKDVHPLALEARLSLPLDLFFSLCPSSVAPLREAQDVRPSFFFAFLSDHWAPCTLSTSSSKNSIGRLCCSVARLSGSMNATKCQLGLRRGLEGGVLTLGAIEEGRL